MDDTGAGDLITHLNALALRSERELFRFMATLDRATLAGLLAHVPRDCDCHFTCPDHAAGCACPCPHVREATASKSPLCTPAMAYLLWIWSPKAYAEPAAAAEPSCNTNPETQVSVMAERYQRRQALWHPADWIHRGVDGVDGRLARQTGRLRNGADVVGDLVLEGGDED